MEALFAVILQLVNSTPGCQALASAGLIPNFLPMLKDYDPKHYGLVGSPVCYRADVSVGVGVGVGEGGGEGGGLENATAGMPA